MNLKISGKWALITGGVNGIGEEISRQLAAEGVNLVVTSRTQEPIDRLKKNLAEYPVSTLGIVVDFLEENWFDRFKDNINDIPIQILVNNAGHNLNITDPYCPIEDWNRILELNFFTAVRLCNLLIPKMKAASWGRIVNITSVAGVENMGPVTYGVAKASLTTYTRTMGRILATEGGEVVMTAIFPGVVVTKGGHWDRVLKEDPKRAQNYLKERCPLGRFGESNEVSSVVAFYCSNHASFSHGAIIPVDGGQARSYMYHNFLC
jgi:NAD(P)-dependent dehydrogenase (short-subunit alcohol dehydrogenase family)